MRTVRFNGTPSEARYAEALAAHHMHAYSQVKLKPKSIGMKKDSDPNNYYFNIQQLFASKLIGKRVEEDSALEIIEGWPTLSIEKETGGNISIPFYKSVARTYESATRVLGRLTIVAQIFSTDKGVILGTQSTIPKSFLERLITEHPWEGVYWDNELVYLEKAPLFLYDWMQLAAASFCDTPIPDNVQSKPSSNYEDLIMPRYSPELVMPTKDMFKK